LDNIVILTHNKSYHFTIIHTTLTNMPRIIPLSSHHFEREANPSLHNFLKQNMTLSNCFSVGQILTLSNASELYSDHFPS
jgi:hypothetical protein